MWAIFTTRTAALAYVAAVDEARGYPCAGDPPAEFPFGWTLTHGDPLRRPDGRRWAVPVDAAVEPDGATTVETLPAEWLGSDP